MSQLDALRTISRLRERLVEFSLEVHHVPSIAHLQALRAIWSGRPEHGGLVSELWVEGVYPSKLSGDTLKSLATEGLFNADLLQVLDRPEAMPAGRKLYTHQSAALRQAQPGTGNRWPTLTVSAGTGAGKTESFLLPILNLLYQQPRKGPGMQCLILYPMNALVNDQMDRLDRWLKSQDRLRYFHFTSETPERTPRDRRKSVSARVPSREEARQRTPDIVITNYSMLEYMLCRPQDAPFFGEGLRAIVLDEAHLYTGALAAEIAMLLRRVQERCGLQPAEVLSIATSATLGGDTDALQAFTATLFTKDPALVHVIQGERVNPVWEPAQPPTEPPRPDVLLEEWLAGPTIRLSAAGDPVFALESTDVAAVQKLADHMPALVSQSAVKLARQQEPQQGAAHFLYDTLRLSPLVQRLGILLAERGRMTLSGIAYELWEGDNGEVACQATAQLLRLAAAARRELDQYPLIPHRLHVLTRQPQGITVCLNSSCTADESLPRWPGLGYATGDDYHHCPYCNHTMLPLLRCDGCGAWGMRRLADKSGQDKYRVVLLISSSDLPREEGVGMVLDPRSGELRPRGSVGLHVQEVKACLRCNGDEWVPLASQGTLILSIQAEAVLESLPELPVPYREFLPSQGRRLLAFSDSRREAAALGPRLTRQHELQVFRALLADELYQSQVSQEELDYLWKKVQDMEQLLRQTPEGSLRFRLSRDLEQARKEHMDLSAGRSMEDWASRLSSLPGIANLLDFDFGESDTGEDWHSQAGRNWAYNKQKVGTSLISRLGQELAAPMQRQVSIETLGFAEVVYPGLDRAHLPSSVSVQLPQQAAMLLNQNWPTILALLLDTIRALGCITLGSNDLDASYQQGSAPIGKWMGLRDRGWRLESFVGSIEPTRESRRQRFVRRLLELTGVSSAEIKVLIESVLEAAFLQLYFLQEDWIEHGKLQAQGSKRAVQAFRINFHKLALRAPVEIWHCPVTGELWPRQICGIVPVSQANRKVQLQRVTSAELDQDPRIGRRRQELRNSDVFRMALWADEHSAQLSPDENRRRQELFRIGARNILSATTTMELGIDIGGLQCAFITNVPPGIANYLQRAGRVGRRTDGSSLVLTFCRSRSFDQEVFRHLGEYLGRTPSTPSVLLNRERIVRRHLHAWMLGKFYREYRGAASRDHTGAMQAFGLMAQFAGEPEVIRWEGASTSKPPLKPCVLPQISDPSLPWWKPGCYLHTQFVSYLQWAENQPDIAAAAGELLHDTAIAPPEADWAKLCREAQERFSKAVADWQELYQTQLNNWTEISAVYSSRDRATANAICYQLKELRQETVIEALSSRGVLPSYGFPTNVLDLLVFRDGIKVSENERQDRRFGLKRSAPLAIAEYVPGSNLIAKGELVKSKALLKHWTGANIDSTPGRRWCLAGCKNMHQYYYQFSSGIASSCPFCEEPQYGPALHVLEIREGFRTATWDPPSRALATERIGSRKVISLVGRAGDAQITRREFVDLAGIAGLHAYYLDEAPLLAYNSGQYETIYDSDLEVQVGGNGFRICLLCGFSLPELANPSGNQRGEAPPGFSGHQSVNRPKMNKRNQLNRGFCLPQEQQNLILDHHLLAAFQHTEMLWLDFSRYQLRDRPDVTLASLAIALKLAGSWLLEIDSRELDFLLTPPATGEGKRSSNGIILFDSTEGGAGHVLELSRLGPLWFETAQRYLHGDESSHQPCRDACLHCLLSFDTQNYHTQGLLNWRSALYFLSHLLNGTPLSQLYTVSSISTPLAYSVPLPEERMKKRKRGKPGLLS